MKLLTKEIIEALPPIYATENIKLEDKIVICKFFSPVSNWTWYVFEGEKQANGDYYFFGMVHGFERECGYFLLSQLTEVKLPGGLKIERDRPVFKIPYREFCDE